MKQREAILIIATVFAISSAHVSCEKETIDNSVNIETIENGKVKSHSLPNDNNENCLKKFIFANHLSKGRFDDYTEDIETSYAYYSENKNIKYKTMKVFRQSDPNKYFYIMLTNLNIPHPTESWSYAYDTRNDSVYGKLYSKQGADYFSERIYMETMTYRNGNKWRERPVFAQLISKKDLADLFSCSFEEFYSQSEHLLIDNWELFPNYYDAFVFGLEGETSDSAANHTLAGYKNSISIYDPRYDPYHKFKIEWLEEFFQEGYFSKKNMKGYYWMKEHIEDATNILNITRKNDWDKVFKWEASIAANYSNNSYDKYAFSVRYVFDPFYE